MGKWYGSVEARLEEGHNYTGRDHLEAGDDITMYLWSDQRCYWITEVVSEKEIKVKEYHVYRDHDELKRLYPDGHTMGHQSWRYLKTAEEVKDEMRSWDSKYWTEENLKQVTEELYFPERTWVFRYGKWWEKYEGVDGKTHYSKLDPISFGVRRYYHDWSF